MKAHLFVNIIFLLLNENWKIQLKKIIYKIARISPGKKHDKALTPSQHLKMNITSRFKPVDPNKKPKRCRYSPNPMNVGSFSFNTQNGKERAHLLNLLKEHVEYARSNSLTGVDRIFFKHGTKRTPHGVCFPASSLVHNHDEII